MELGKALSLGNWYDSAINMLFEARNTQKTNTSFKAKIILIYPNGMGETYFGYTDGTNKVLFCPILLRVWINPKPYYISGIKTFIVSSLYHKTLDITALANKVKINAEAIVSWKYLRTWNTIKVEGVNCVDLNLLDNDLSDNWSIQTNQILATKSLEILSEIPRRVYILSCIISGLVGGLIFSFMTVILMIVLQLVMSAK